MLRIESVKRLGKKIIVPVLIMSVLCSGTASAMAGTVNTSGVAMATAGMLNKVSQQDIDKAKQERDYARQQAQNTSNRLSNLRGERTELEGQLADLTKLSDEQKAQYEIIATQLQAALDAKAAALDRFIIAQDNLEEQQQLFADRVNAMFEFQNKSTLEVLLESDSIAGFFTNMEIISLIADADNQAIDELQIAMDDAQLQADRAMDEANEMQEIADAKQAELDELERRIGVTSAALDNVSTQITQAERDRDALNAEAARLDKKVKDLTRQYQAQQATAYSGGGTKTVSGVSFTWPVASRNITDPYGQRIHPITGVKKMHTGIDIGSGYGSTIVAAASGTVILVNLPVPGKNTGGTGYGNYLIINHGNGITTLYGHCRNIFVRNGQSVSQGQKIAEVGSTGSSTGPHLHFEVRVNGSTVNPRKYLP
ncbi:Murein DD-endopeptidase MepM and murein hydrolase activator NlpD, contain LysM domain [Ruminococcaceae bacterium YRB3002]|nr:Murein DD-endopeptidase MepM and murein hydrolase activator NlpD, contain LysM domain [Ruminococcaceae bacterium YRB3002]